MIQLVERKHIVALKKIRMQKYNFLNKQLCSFFLSIDLSIDYNVLKSSRGKL